MGANLSKGKWIPLLRQQRADARDVLSHEADHIWIELYMVVVSTPYGYPQEEARKASWKCEPAENHCRTVQRENRLGNRVASIYLRQRRVK